MYERDYVTYLTVQAVSVVYGFAYRNLTETLLVSKYILTSRAGRLRVGLFSADTSTIKKNVSFFVAVKRSVSIWDRLHSVYMNSVVKGP